MENASKALLMAAGVLMGVLVLSLIVYIYATFSDTTQKNMEQMKLNELNAFNSKYLAYDGKSDLTYYDVVSIVTMALNDNKADIEGPQITVQIKNLPRDLYPSGQLWLANLNASDDTHDPIKRYNEFVGKGYELGNFDSDEGLIMKKTTVANNITGAPTDVKVLIKYGCSVMINQNTGRVSVVQLNWNV